MEWVTTAANNVPEIIADRLSNLLDAGKVTWFVSGGSNIQIQTKTIQLLKNRSNLGRLTVLLVDERFGLVDHPNSNWTQLQSAGLMVDGPRYIAPFTSAERTLDVAVVRYQAIIDNTLSDGSYTYAQFGMGDDGHISGILPDSPAATAEGRSVFGYEHAPYQRLTTTFETLAALDEVALVAYGENKWPQLAKLAEPGDKTKQPVQILKEIEKVTIYTDYRHL